jgi:hypothetical protein
MAYAVLVDRLERHVMNERLIAVVLATGGAKDVDVPDFATEQAALDRLLDDTYEDRLAGQPSPETQDLMVAVGLA